MTNWDQRFLDLAKHVSLWSKDPTGKIGAVISDNLHRVVGLGINGFPRGIADTPERLNERKVKYALTIHAEVNALLNSNKSVVGCSVYTHPFSPCERCAVELIQSGVQRVISPPLPEEFRERWYQRLSVARELLLEANVEVVTLG